MHSKPITVQEGHIFIPVRDLSRAFKFYRDLLVIPVLLTGSYC